MDLRELVSVATRRPWVVVTVVVVAVLASGAFALVKAPVYESTVVLALTPAGQQGQAAFTADHLSALMGTYAETAKSSSNRRRAEALLGRPLDATLDTTTERGTGILRISARAETRSGARVAAGAAARTFEATLGGNAPLAAEVVDGPTVPGAAVQPRAPIIVATAALLGLVGGLLLALALERLRPRVRTAADVAALTPAPVLGEVPRLRAKASPGWARRRNETLPASVRALRTNLEPVLGEQGRCVQLTSPVAGQERSLVVAALGVALARIGRPTLIVDADLHAPHQGAIFGVEANAGLSDALASRRPPEFVPTVYEHLWLIPAGARPDASQELLRTGLETTLSGLAAQGWLVLVDSPPMSEPDARILARAVDGVLLVLQVGSLRPAQLRVALDALTLVDAPLLGVVLDGAEDDDGARGGQDASRAPGIVASTATAPAMPPGLRERDAPPAEAS